MPAFEKRFGIRNSTHWRCWAGTFKNLIVGVEVKRPRLVTPMSVRNFQNGRLRPIRSEKNGRGDPAIMLADVRFSPSRLMQCRWFALFHSV